MKNQSNLIYIVIGVGVLLLVSIVVLSLMLTALFIARPALLARQGEAGDSESGLIVTAVDPQGLAAAAGIVRGDILQKVNGVEVGRLQDIVPLMRSLESGEVLELTVLHGDDEITVEIKPEIVGGRPQLGLNLCCGSDEVPLPERASEERQADLLSGILVIEVISASPAEEAGLRAGDLVLHIDGESVSASGLSEFLGSYDPGDEITLDIARGGEEPSTIRLALGAHPEDPERAFLGIRYQSIQDLEGLENFELPEGLPFEDFRGPSPPLPEEDIPFHGGELSVGVVVRAVRPNSPAAAGGLQFGDMILSVEGEPLDSPEMLVDEIARRSPGDKIEVLVLRGRSGEEFSLVITLGQHPDEPTRAYLGIEIGGVILMPPGSGNGPGFHDLHPFLLPEDSASAFLPA